MKRRNFFKTAIPAVLLPSFLNGFSVKALANNPSLLTLMGGQTQTDKVLVLLYLGGGNDGINTVIPLDQYTTLAGARTNILIDDAQVLPLNGVTDTGLHPALTGFRDLYNEGKLCIVQGVGYPTPNFSHFRSTDIWVSGADSNQVLDTGWIGRYLDNEYPGYPTGYPNANMPDPLALQIGGTSPLLFQGDNANMVFTVSGPSIFTNWNAGINDPAPATPAGDELTYARMIASQTQLYAQAVIGAFSSVTNQYAGYPVNNPLGDALKAIARLIKGGLKTRVYAIGVGGFDTHASQTDVNDTTIGTHANLLKMLSDAVYAFQQDLEYLSIDDRVIGMTFSEFGRRIMSNDSLGTDHGAAGPMFLFGTKVQSGIIGSNPTIPANVSPDDNLPMQYDFRSVYSSVLKDWFCVPQPELDSVMLQTFQHLPVVQANCFGVGVAQLFEQEKQISVVNYPNPFTERTTISFQTLGGNTQVQIFDGMGRLVSVPVNGHYVAGRYEITFYRETLAVGNYYCRLQNGPLQKVSVMSIVT